MYCRESAMAERVAAIQVEQLSKRYKLYDKPSDRMKEALGLSRKKRYKEHYALKNVNMTIYQGETMGIIGTNGSGKSTILKIITGVLNPTGGQVTVNGRISALLELGAGFNMEYNGIENIYLNGTMIGFSREEIDAKLENILEFADIGDYIHQPVKTYSSGMFVRLAFAVAINIDPEILIVDEALSVGDVFFQAKCYHKFEEFKQMGKTILFVSHDLSSISKYCDRVVLLNQGTKLGEGTPKDMIDVYKRVLVGQYNTEPDNTAGAAKEADETDGSGPQEIDLLSDGELRAAAKTGKDCSKQLAEDLLEYGSRQAEITECFLTDDRGERTSAIIKGTEFSVHMKMKFYDALPAPIFAFSFKDVRGTEITGTNSMVEKAFLEGTSAGEEKEAVFTQKMSLQGGDYLLSLGLTGYEGDAFKVYHRLYDVLHVTVISDKNTVGYYDMDSKVTIL